MDNVFLPGRDLRPDLRHFQQKDTIPYYEIPILTIRSDRRFFEPLQRNRETALPTPGRKKCFAKGVTHENQ
jgi:hypothetical protein